ncbi:hypothetical protein DMENIID0001_037880 [Sergentomyia squamirostris]
MDQEYYQTEIGRELKRGKKRVYAQTHADKNQMSAPKPEQPSQSSQAMMQKMKIVMQMYDFPSRLDGDDKPYVLTTIEDRETYCTVKSFSDEIGYPAGLIRVVHDDDRTGLTHASNHIVVASSVNR